MSSRILIPTVSVDLTVIQINQFFKLYHDALLNLDRSKKITFDFSNCNFFSNHACVFLGGLERFLKTKNNISEILFENQKNNVNNYFHRLGFFERELGWTHFPFSNFSMEEIASKKPYKDIVKLLSSDLFPFKSGDAKIIIKDTMGELFLNVFQHSESPGGATASAQYYPSEKIIRFTIVDFGIGISRHIRNYVKKKHKTEISNQEALLKAFEEGFTTKEQPYGTGLKTIKDFICLNDSRMSIFCNNIFYQYNGKSKKETGYILHEKREFGGTFIAIDFNTDKICYSIEVTNENKN